MLNVCLAHLLGDFLLQPGWMVVAKRSGLVGLVLHALIIVGCTAAVLTKDLATVWAVVLLAGAAHLCIEVVTISLRERMRLSGTTVFVLDQLLHVASLAFIVTAAGPGIWSTATHTLTMHVAAPYLALIDGLLFVTALGAILVFEIDRAVGVEERAVLPYDLGRVLGMVERGASLLAAVIVHPAFAVVPFVPRAVSAALAQEDARRRRMVDVASGIALSMLAYSFIIAVGTMSR